jgi:hypothetical protein
MAILKASIESFINVCMEDGISAASLTEAIKLCLRDISNIGLLVGSDTDQTLADGDLLLTVPAEYKDVLSIQLTDDGGLLQDPLEAVSGGYDEYLLLMADSVTTGTPDYYSEYDGSFYLYPPPDDDYTVNIAYQKYDNQDDTDIEFGDEFSNALKFGSLYFYAMMKSRERYVALWGPKYEVEKEMRRLNMKKQPAITR